MTGFRESINIAFVANRYLMLSHQRHFSGLYYSN